MLLSFGLGLGLAAVTVDLLAVMVKYPRLREYMVHTAWKMFVGGMVCVLLGGGV